MSWLDPLERRFESVTIPQFPLFLATANGLVYLMAQFEPAFVQRLLLHPGAVLERGEWWRVVTFLFVPPMTMNPIFLVFWLLMLYRIAQDLENAWGEFRFFLFYLIGAIATVLAALFISREPVGNVPLNTTLFLAFATLYPDFGLLVFPIPWSIKVKYIAYFFWFTTALSFFMGSFGSRVTIGASLANYALFFGQDIWKSAQLKWEVYQNRKRFRS